MIFATTLLLLLQGTILDGTQSKPVPAAAAAAQDADRPVLSPAELKALRDTNIFAPKGRRPTVINRDPARPSKSPTAPPKPKPPLVTGIFFDAKAACFLVVVEDRNEASLKLFKEPKFLKTGDEVAGYKVGPVTAEKAVFLKGEISKELHVGEPLPGADGKPVTDAAASDDPESFPEGEEKAESKSAEAVTKPLDPAVQTQVLENMKKKRGKKDRPGQDE